MANQATNGTAAQDSAPKQGPLSVAERAILKAVAETAIPAGKLFPGAGEAALNKVEDFLSVLPPALAKSYRALLWSVEAQARLRTGRSFRKLTVERRFALLEAWRKSGSYARRLLLRGLLTPLKMSHYADESMYAQLGCTFTVAPPSNIETPRYMTERVAKGEDLEADDTVEADAVVIGTGAGGAVVARELAEQGHAVVMLEEGAYFTRKDFDRRTVEAQRRMYRDASATGTIGNVFIPVPLGKTVGGTTTINSGTCYRVPERVLRKWRDQFGLSEFSSDALAPHYERVERILGVAPNEAKYLGSIARVIARGCDKLGYKHGPLKRNAPECDGQGVCCFGCPTDAKRSMNVSYVPMALKAGAQLFTGMKAIDILTEGGAAVGVVAQSANGRRLTVRARAVVVACGTFHTPVLLDSVGLGNASGQLGRNLSIHPAMAMAVEFPELLRAYNGVPQGYAIEEFHDEGILFEGGMMPLEFGASVLQNFGPEYVKLMESYDRMGLFGFMIEDTSRGRVRNVKGRPVATYFLNDHDVARLKRGAEILGRVYFAAGAKRVFPMVHGFDEWRSEADMAAFRRATVRARDFDLSAYHPLGTARMGRDPSSSVVGPDHRVHDVRGLYVTDGSAVPSSLAVNPQLTIMAMATRAAISIGQALERPSTQRAPGVAA